MQRITKSQFKRDLNNSYCYYEWLATYENCEKFVNTISREKIETHKEKFLDCYDKIIFSSDKQYKRVNKDGKASFGDISGKACAIYNNNDCYFVIGDTYAYCLIKL